MTEEVTGREERLDLSEDDRARIAKLRLRKRGHGIDPDLHERFEHTLAQLSDVNIVEFEALAFFRAFEVEKPYTALKNAPNMCERDYVFPLLREVCDRHAGLIAQMRDPERAWATETGPEPVPMLFARALSLALARPGCAPGPIEPVAANEESGWLHYQREAGGAVNSYFSAQVWHGLAFDTFFFFQDEEAFGADTSLSISMDYLTEVGVEFARWLFPERVEELFQIEAAVRQ